MAFYENLCKSVFLKNVKKYAYLLDLKIRMIYNCIRFEKLRL